MLYSLMQTNNPLNCFLFTIKSSNCFLFTNLQQFQKFRTFAPGDRRNLILQPAFGFQGFPFKNRDKIYLLSNYFSYSHFSFTGKLFGPVLKLSQFFHHFSIKPFLRFFCKVFSVVVLCACALKDNVKSSMFTRKINSSQSMKL